MTQPRATPPRFLFLQTNNRCNLRCTHCDYWKLDDDDRANYLSPVSRHCLIEEFAELGGQYVVTCGGEPMLDLAEYFQLWAACRAAGVSGLSVINGTRVQTKEVARRMVTEGPSEITVSLDHWQPAEHDRLRGVKNSHAMAVKALELLREARLEQQLELRRSSSRPVKLYAMTILSEDTWPTLDRFYEFALDGIGVDKLKLNIIQPTFRGVGQDAYFAGARVSDVAACMAMIRKCDQRWSIPRNPAWLEAVEMYLRSVSACASPLLGWKERGTTEAICNSYDRNIMVDLYGRARLCFSGSFPAVQLTGPGDLTSFWQAGSLPIRESMLGCKQFCGVSHSVRAASSLLKGSL